MIFQSINLLTLFSISLAAKCLFLNDEPCMFRPTVINMDELKYYPFMIILILVSGRWGGVWGEGGGLIFPLAVGFL